MIFTDYLFFPLSWILFGLYFAIPQKWRWFLLLMFSALLYCTWGVELLPYAVGAIVIAWFAARRIDRRYLRFEEQITKKWNAKKKAEELQKIKKKCRRILWIAATLLIGLIVFSKTTKIMILGLSYYTLSLIGYVADVYWRKEKAEKNILKLALFALYFPKIFEGPIAKHRNIAEQLNMGGSFEYKRFCFGLQRMLWGYFKKLVIADRVSLLVTTVFADYETPENGALFLVAAVFGAVQLYCDFSGCMDIALGFSEALGITLEENFKRPFYSESAAEFWRRWHITLGAWFKDYIYMPIVISPQLIKISGWFRDKAGKRAGKAIMIIVPSLVVWSLTGLWHGTGWNYILWGAYWGLLIILSSVLEPEFRKLVGFLRIDVKSKGYRLFRRVRTFLFFVISRIITIPADVQSTGKVFQSILTDFAPWKLVDGSIFTLGLDRPNFTVAVLAIVLLGFISKKQEGGVCVREVIASKPLALRWIIYLAGIFAVMIFGVYGAQYDASAFVYMNY